MVRAVMIVEMAGRPAEHVKATLSKHIGVLGTLKDIEVHSIKISEPAPIEKAPGMFTCFTETDFETENLARMTELVFDFMPSSIEITGPSKLHLESVDATTLLNTISGRLHRYDEVARTAQFRYKQLEAQLQKMQEVPLEAPVEEDKSKKKKVVKKKVVKKKVSKKKPKK